MNSFVEYIHLIFSYIYIYIYRGPSSLWTLHPLGRTRPLGGPSTLEGPSTLRTKIFESLVRSRPLGGPSTLWTCYIFYLVEGPSILGFSSFSPFRRSVHPVYWIEFSPSMGSVLFCGLYNFHPMGVRPFCGLIRILNSKT